jgi:hypothetical protein
MNLPFYSHKFVDKLHQTAEANIGSYGNGAGWLDALADGLPAKHNSSIAFGPPPELLLPESKNVTHDAENAKRIYNWLSTLAPAVAMEERLWACLTHTVFAEYMSKRWPVDTASAVHRRYLLEGKTFAGLCRNGIARLWWAGYLTHMKDRANPFELTETLFMRQDIQVSLLERAIGKCRNVRIAVLDFLRENQAWLGEESFGWRIQQIIKGLNLLGGVVILDAIPPTELHDYVKRIAVEITQEGGAA